MTGAVDHRAELADFLRATVEEGEPYLHVDDLTSTLQDARSRAVGALPGRRG